ncbi:M23 family metallopeptidase [Paenibacillus sp. PL91]|uniref:M23 family metallopeptidase n=1 Tax=Paenibacillus sp. PL91 TaxID=2729538 RepID=UPI00145F20B5|nr:M23 family metallopeptidase [Paenibacillus sp. PL91]MBC9200445.1 M23 family metallopeptidase [Paenibacillus sp. PL91]
MKRARNPKWSFVVMRGADKTVKQFHVSKRSVFAVPTAAVLAVTGCIGGLQMKSAYELHHLEEQLSKQDAQFAQTVTDKDRAITSLQHEILGLSRQSLEMKAKIDELQQLELKLKQFIDNYGNKAAPSSYLKQREAKGSTSRTQPILTNISSAHSTSLEDSKSFALLAQNTSYDLTSLGRMVDTMEETLGLTLELAQTTRSTVDAYPSSWPTRSKLLTSGFGYRSDPFTGRSTFHAGIDITGKLDDPILSAADGTVSEIGYNSSLGHYIVIDHLGGLQSAYMHLKEVEASKGDDVVRGEKIGLLGSSGRSTGPHLHFQIMQKNEPVNPIKFLALIKED